MRQNESDRNGIGKRPGGDNCKVCTYLADKNANVLEISQTIVKGYFDMLMIIDITAAPVPPANLPAG